MLLKRDVRIFLFVVFILSSLQAGQSGAYHLLELEGLLTACTVDRNYVLTSSETVGFCITRSVNVALGSEQMFRNNSMTFTSFASGEYRFFFGNTALSGGILGGWRHLFIGIRSFASPFVGLQTGFYYLYREPVSVRLRYKFLAHPDSPHVYANALLIGFSLNLLKKETE